MAHIVQNNSFHSKASDSNFPRDFFSFFLSFFFLTNRYPTYIDITGKCLNFRKPIASLELLVQRRKKSIKKEKKKLRSGNLLQSIRIRHCLICLSSLSENLLHYWRTFMRREIFIPLFFLPFF